MNNIFMKVKMMKFHRGYFDLSISVLLVLLSFPMHIFAEEINQNVCAKVRIKLEQEAVVTRSAFRASLRIINSSANEPLESLFVNLDLRDAEGNDAKDLFFVNIIEIVGIDDINGSGILSPSSAVEIIWEILPYKEAAVSDIKNYFVGGQIRYTQGGSPVSIELWPNAISVHPEPNLHVKYFLEKNVYGDDPFTQEVEAAEPFALGLTVTNDGGGTAWGLHISAAQPKIIENDKGLLVAFTMVGTQVGTVNIAPSLKVNFGDIEPGETEVARWLMTSSIEGEFTEYKASFIHNDDMGGSSTSIIENVEIHELIHAIRIDDPEDDFKTDFLVSDIPDEDENPDVIHTSQGFTLPVNLASDINIDSNPQPGNMHVQLTSTVPSGWIYIKVEDPADRAYRLIQVVRSDGKIIRIGDNSWTTHRIKREAGQPPALENLLHIVDNNSTGSYTLFYEQKIDHPDIVVSPESIDFGEQNINTLSASHIPISLTNHGENELTFQSNGIEIIGPDADLFQFSDVPLTIPLAPHDSRLINITFHPDSIGLKSASIQIATNDPDTPTLLIPVLGIGIDPPVDTDSDGMIDQWEAKYFASMERDGRGDFDGDGFSDRQEHDGCSNPTDTESYLAETTIALNKGFNLVAIPSGSECKATLNDWLPELGDGTEIERVLSLDPNSQSCVRLAPEDQSNPIQPQIIGKGVIAYARLAKTVTFTSVNCAGIDLKQGLNIVGLACAPQGYTASQLLLRLGNENAASVQCYNPDKGMFESIGFEENGEITGVDFPIHAGEGYFIFMKSDVIHFTVQ